MPEHTLHMSDFLLPKLDDGFAEALCCDTSLALPDLIPHGSSALIERRSSARTFIFSELRGQPPLETNADSPFPIYYGLTVAFRRCIQTPQSERSPE
jgi:hypothetical protein